MMFFKKKPLNINSGSNDLIRKAYCLLMYSHGIAIIEKQRLSEKYPELELNLKGTEFDCMCIVGACYAANRKVGGFGNEKLIKEIDFIILTCLKIWNDALLDIYFKYADSIQLKVKSANRAKSPDYNIKWAVGSEILEALGFESTAYEDLVQELGKIFGTDFLNYWSIPLADLEPFQMDDFNLESLLKIVQGEK